MNLRAVLTIMVLDVKLKEFENPLFWFLWLNL